MQITDTVTLKGPHASLEPLTQAHCTELKAAVDDGEIWRLWYTNIPKPENMAAEIDRRRDMHAKGQWLPFAVRRCDNGAVCGMTNYMNIDAVNRRVEIGATWYAASAQRTAVNTEAKLLLLAHAFEALKCIAVEFRTNFFNFPSRAAIARLGAKQDGILRNHLLMEGGGYRDTVVFSIIDSEWPMVKRNLQAKLAR
ncbi:MAG: GNAT family N-acetyltransferase [Burkholderiaceae bacterium]|nr:GNAT family N-acetyltransferase [Burkholderiaceae bacterium]